MFSAIVLLVVLSCGLGEEFSNPDVDFGSRVLGLLGRSTTTIERHPYAVQVLRADRIVCAGTLISQRHVLTSAHCFYNENGSLLNARDFTIRTGNSTVSSRSRKGTGGGSSGGSGGSGSGGSGSGGSGSGGSGSGGSGSGSGGWCLFRCGSNNNNNNNGNGNSNNQQGNPIQYVTRIIVHERYAQTRPDNDIAVALMAAAVTLSGSTRAATLPHAGHAVPDNMTLLHVGWDTTLAALNMTRPRELSAPKLSRAECEQRYSELGALSGDPQHITDNMLCSGQPDSGGVSCADDSGGPVVSGGVVVGVAWWGYGCARAQHPAVSARVAQYADWINDTMSRNSVAGPASPALGKLMVLTIVATTVLNKLFLK